MPIESSADVFVEPAPTFTPDDLRAVLRDHWGLTDAAVTPLDSERDLNALVDGRFVLKLANPAERPDVVDMETRALAHVAVADPELPIPQVVSAVSGGSIVRVVDAAGRDCMARLITVVPGTPVEGTRLDTALAERIGSTAGRMSVALQGFFHPAAARDLIWDIRRLPAGQSPLAARVAPALAATALLPSGVQHSDVTLTNVLAEAGAITGVIDFGDIHHTAAVCDLAATLTAVLRSTSDEPARVWRLTDAVLTGYQRHRPLTPAEVSVLGELVIARLVVTLAVSEARRGRHRDNYRYITQYDRASERILDLLAAVEPDRLADRMDRVAGTRDLATAVPSGGLPGRRAAAMGGRLAPLFYDRPVELVSGRGPWLFAADGTRYLDAYNNVPVTGHAHPAVTNAVSRQLTALNTHSRYLHPGIVELAERILATMPAGLDTCLFTTSGTEANELAWRLATEYTGGTAAVIAEHAYHGTTKWMADLSSNEWPPGHRPDHVATFEAPRGPDLTRSVAVRRVVGAVAGERPALVLADSQFTSEGVLDAPDEFMAGLVDGAHGRRAVPGRRGAVGLRPQRAPVVALRAGRDHTGHRDAGQTDGRRLPDRRRRHPPRDRRRAGRAVRVLLHVRRDACGGSGRSRGPGRARTDRPTGSGRRGGRPAAPATAGAGRRAPRTGRGPGCGPTGRHRRPLTRTGTSPGGRPGGPPGAGGPNRAAR
jgi:Ser/Thr protein kinase RdoA (MazF antagonist)